jgi:pyrimidine deaminase RibD-like protein
VEEQRLTVDRMRQEHYMALALELSKRALPDCLPNPPVGCVLVRDNAVIASGHTRAPGDLHAEAAALAAVPAAESALAGISAFVTLEPCSFQGRTPSCAKALIERGIEHVYVAMRDPDPRNDGKGLALLTEAGITVHEHVLASAVAQFLTPFLRNNECDTYNKN